MIRPNNNFKRIEPETYYHQVTFSSANDAIIWLNKYAFEFGKSVVVRYISDQSTQEVEEMTAIGIKTGTGYNSYRIANHNGRNVIAGIVTQNNLTINSQFVQKLFHGEVYVLYNKSDYSFHYVYHSNPFGTGRALLKEILEETEVTSLENGITYILRPGQPLDLYSKLLELEERIEGASNSDIEDLKRRLQTVEDNYVKVSYLTESDYLAETGGNVDFEDNILYLLKGDATYNDVNQVCVVGGYWQGHPFKFCKDAKWVIDSKDPWEIVLNVLLGSGRLQADTSGNFTGTIPMVENQVIIQPLVFLSNLEILVVYIGRIMHLGKSKPLLNRSELRMLR